MAVQEASLDAAAVTDHESSPCAASGLSFGKTHQSQATLAVQEASLEAAAVTDQESSFSDPSGMSWEKTLTSKAALTVLRPWLKSFPVAFAAPCVPTQGADRLAR